jgi:hypothetical protein
MNPFRTLVGCFLVVAVAVAAVAPREEAVLIFGNRKVSCAVPEGFNYATARDDLGLVHIRLEHDTGKVSLELRFMPDPESQFSTARARREMVAEMFSSYVESSTEKGIQFEELGPRTGAGTYCVFTDAKLVGQAKLPAGEYLHLTAGVKTWPGVVVLFQLFSNETTST